MLRGFVLALVCLVCLSAVAWSQSLGEVARKERERREKNKESGVVAREISEDEIFDDEDGDSSDEAQPGEGDDEGSGMEAGTLPERIDIDLESDEAIDLEEERRDRRREEAEWRGRLQRARQRVAAAEKHKATLDSLHLASGEYYVDGQGRVVIESLDHLRRLVAEAEAELRDARQALERLLEEARRAGVPRGWLR